MFVLDNGKSYCDERSQVEVEIYMVDDTVTRLRRKDYKPQLQANVYAAAECGDPRSGVHLERS